VKKQVGNVQLMQKINRLKVLNYIRENPSVSRLEITKNTGLSVATLTNITSYLLEKNLLVDDGIEEVNRVGRKTTLLRFNGNGYSLVCISVAENGIYMYHTNLCGTVIKKDFWPVEDRHAEVLCKCLTEFLQTMDCKHILGIGIFVSGIVLDEGKKVISVSIKWNEYDVIDGLKSITDLPVFVDNVTQLKAVSHYWKQKDKNQRNSVFIDMENGIGAAHFCEGELNRSFLGEIGHVTVEKEGEPCFCGNYGCLEVMCSAKRVLSLYEHKTGEKVSLSTLQKRAQSGDSAANEVINECAEYLGMSLANLVNLLIPTEFVFDAGEFKNCPILIERAFTSMKKRAYRSLVKDVQILEVSLTDEELLKGMSTTMCNHIFDINFESDLF